MASPDESEDKLFVDNNNVDDEADSDEEKGKKGANGHGGNQGRRKIDIEFIEVSGEIGSLPSLMKYSCAF